PNPAVSASQIFSKTSAKNRPSQDLVLDNPARRSLCMASSLFRRSTRLAPDWHGYKNTLFERRLSSAGLREGPRLAVVIEISQGPIAAQGKFARKTSH
ncbi:MAG TPA: hypothetical protein VG754_03115, partial [Verrucomicrobiae bacterium]|nr:hypothetical protein [Verrucomicrobiae bacterium]